MIPNEIIFDAYCEKSEEFYNFLRMFSDLANTQDFPTKLKQIKSYLIYIG